MVGPLKREKPLSQGASKVKPGNVLLSHPVSGAVPSVLEGLTSVFGMGTGVTPPLEPPSLIIEKAVEKDSLTTEQRVRQLAISLERR